jgi:antitoxin ParD1/3/4
MSEYGKLREAALDEVRHKIAVGLDQAERGEVFDGDEVFREILEKLETVSPGVQSSLGSR